MDTNACDPNAFDSTRPNAARIYGELSHGKDGLQPDREVSERLLEIAPKVRSAARANRDFLLRAVGSLAEQDHDQFIDFGTGLPAARSIHEVVQAVTPDARVVYVDNDRQVVLHGRAVLEGENVVMLFGDVRRPDAVFNHPVLTRVIDVRRPVVVIAGAVLHFVPDQDAAAFIQRLRARLAPGGTLVFSHACSDRSTPEEIAKGQTLYAESATPLLVRSSAQIAALLEGCDMEEPGLVEVPLWRPEPGPPPEDVGNALLLGCLADLNAYGFPAEPRPEVP
ncbi:SAM-dependent methyltransferase [Spongiactinospora rosea]|uniref:SAM-dependent methyltransferase n=1 Tax=Spongiactinospora rosea TaxID=2248750 RepID=A0A366LYW0_9ACTN|nr:SAM-dependent methyltransferase [Spongiactinospora rosea]RBQ19125.1 SAM-dependent methyltransferase [Spongiactinospora rosea]